MTIPTLIMLSDHGGLVIKDCIGDLGYYGVTGNILIELIHGGDDVIIEFRMRFIEPHPCSDLLI
jgi:hypothetical protein